MSTTPETTPSTASHPASPTASHRRAVLVAGSGRSGTSTLAGALQHLGLHVPKPEVVADETNPRGFGESQWVVDFHNRLLTRSVVHVSDARPQAWFETSKISMREVVRDRLADWLSEQAEVADELVIKDPRLSWFLGLWRVAAIRCDVTPCFATMLRPPTEVVGSKKKAYGDRLGDINTMAAWVNMMLHTEQATRGSVRVFIRYHDLLEDWTTSVFRAGEVLGLQRVQNALPEEIRLVHDFIDPSLRRVQATWDDFDGPAPLRDLARESWETLNKLAEPGGDTADVHATLDELREQYSQLYADAEAIARSSATAAARRATQRAQRAAAAAAGDEDESEAPTPAVRRAGASTADRAAKRIPHGARAVLPARLRTRVRRMLDGSTRGGA